MLSLDIFSKCSLGKVKARYEIPATDLVENNTMTKNPTIKQGIALQREGNLRGAASLYREVLNAEKENAEALHYLGLVHYQLGELDQADTLITRSLDIDSSCANTCNDLGMVKVALKQYAEALPHFARALRLKSNHTDALSNLAIALKKLHRFEQAIPVCKRLLELNPQSAQTHCDLAEAQYHTSRLADAIHNYKKAIELDPDCKQARTGLGEALESDGKFKQSKLQYLAVLRRNAHDPGALAKLLQLREGTIDEKWVTCARDLVNSETIEREDKTRLCIALGHYFDRNKAYDDAFRYLELGYSAQLESEPAFNSAEFSKAVEILIELFSKEFFQTAPTSQVESDRPIFILGMPRSGTTLTEQILASHSNVVAAGELSMLSIVSHQTQEFSMNNQPYPYSLINIDHAGLSKLATIYLNRLNEVSSTAPFVTDKYPFNFMLVAVIAVLFPKAKIIHCRRHPIDNCLSCYFTSFADQIKFANSLETLGRYYLDYDRLMKHWDDVLPGRIFEMQYEDLINDTKGKILELLEYCQLEWEESCLTFYETKRGIRTPSRWQVRQPIYASSMQRWRNYEENLAPLKRMLIPLLSESG